jgi:hypothetical protein
MWHYNSLTIDSELKSRIKVQIKINNLKFNGGKKTHNYWINGKRCFCYNIFADGRISGNVYIANAVNNDPKFAVEGFGRKKSWGKRVVILKCGKTDSDKFDYIANLILQVV